MKRIVVSCTLFVIINLAAAQRSNPFVTALKHYCAARMAQGKPVERAFFYLKLSEFGFKQLNHKYLAEGKTGIPKLDGLNRNLHGYLVNWDGAKLGIAFEHKRTELLKLAAIYRQEGKELWEVEAPDAATRGRHIYYLKVVLSPQGTKQHQKFKRSAHYSPDQTGIKELDKLNADFEASISEIFWNGSGNATFILRLRNPIKSKDLELYVELTEQGQESDVASVEPHENTLQD
jgi:hypothetical protein